MGVGYAWSNIWAYVSLMYTPHNYLSYMHDKYCQFVVLLIDLGG